MLGVIRYVYMYRHKMNEKYSNIHSGNRCLTGLWMIFKFPFTGMVFLHFVHLTYVILINKKKIKKITNHKERS